MHCRAISHMERIIVGLKGKLKIDSRAHRGDIYVLMQASILIPFT